MPIPTPHSNESEKKFLSRCMSNKVMLEEYPDAKQRSAICYSQYRKKKTKGALVRLINWLRNESN